MKRHLLAYALSFLFITSFSSSSFGATPLLDALDRGREDAAIDLIRKGADVNTPANNGMTPLHVAIGRRMPRVVDIFIKRGANINAKTNDGRTPLHIVAEYGSGMNFAESLAAAGADINATEKNGITPLFAAVYFDHYLFAEWLMQRGADYTLGAGSAKETPYKFAVRKGNRLMAQLLLLYGVNDEGVQIPILGVDDSIHIEKQGYHVEGRQRYLYQIYVKYRGKMSGHTVDVEYVLIPRSGLFDVVSNNEIKIPVRSEITVIGLITRSMKNGPIEKTVISDIMVSKEKNLFSSLLVSYESFLPISAVSKILPRVEEHSQIDPSASAFELKPRAGITHAADAYRLIALLTIGDDFTLSYHQ
jgi:hypothetical protein